MAFQESSHEEKEWLNPVLHGFSQPNKACLKDEFSLPNIDLLVDSVVGNSMFSVMDGYSGYDQIQMAAKDTEKTTFRTPIGNFFYIVMPFGFKNAGAT